MKKLIFNISIVALVIALMSACEASTNYSQLLKQEQAKIDAYLLREGYSVSVLDTIPSDSLFETNKMYRLPNDGIYIQLIDKGEGDSLIRGDQFILRYMQSTLAEFPVVEDYITTEDRPYPYVMTMGNLTHSCEGWQQAFDIMRRHKSHAIIIVPSKLGRDLQEVEPYLFEMKLKVIPK